MLDTRDRRVTAPGLFRFKKWGLSHADFAGIVHDVWNTPSNGSSAIDNRQFKTRLLRKKVKGWSTNIESVSKKKNKYLLMEFDIFDVLYFCKSSLVR